MKERIPPPTGGSGKEAEPAGRFAGLREEATLQASLRDCLFPQTKDRSAIFASSPLLETTGGRGHWPGQMSGD